MFDGLSAATFHFTYGLVELLLLVAFVVLLSFFVTSFTHLSMLDKVYSVDLNWLSEDLSFFIMIVNENLLALDIELGLFDLLGSWLGLVKFKFLSNLLQEVVSIISLVWDEVISGCINDHVRVNCATSVNEFIFSTFEMFQSFATNLLLSVDKAISNSVMVIPDLSVLVIN